jgi:hypothetical protein
MRACYGEHRNPHSLASDLRRVCGCPDVPVFPVRPLFVCMLCFFNLLKPTCYTNRFNIQQLYILPALYFCVLYLSENK